MFKTLDVEHLEAPDKNYIGHRDIVTRSLARYHFITPYLHGATLDVGCGRGYGLEQIGQNNQLRVGVDISFDFLQKARAAQISSLFACAGGDALPLPANSFDSIIAFEVIEHIEDDHSFIDELKRVIRQNGVIAISTPNRRIASGDSTKPLNPFHIREYTPDEFRHLLSSFFSSVTIIGQVERINDGHLANRWIDRIPINWKYLLPAHIQGVLSVALRPPLRLEDCKFKSEDLEQAHTLMGIVQN